MDHRVPKTGLVISIVCSILATVTFLVLNQAFEGPSPLDALTGGSYELQATFKDTEILPTKQPVLTRGVEVGKVTDVHFNKAESNATVTFTVDDQYAPVHDGATVAIGERTIIGDPYLNLDLGDSAAPELASGDEVKSLPSVDFDEAFSFLDEKGRKHVRSILGTLDDATQDENGATQLNATVAELDDTVDQLHTLTSTLHGQEDDIASIASNGATLFGELGAHEASIRTIVSAGRVTMDALATRTASLEQAVGELPGLLDATRRALADSRPLLSEARPLVEKLTRVAPKLGPAISDVAPLTGDVADSIARLATLPTLKRLLQTVTLVGPVVKPMEAATRNLVTLLRYTAPRANGIGAFFANMAAVTAHGDSDGPWARFAILFEQGETSDTRTPSVCQPEDDIPANAGFCRNAYPNPNDASDPEPYVPGSYPRLRAFKPPKP